MHFQLFFKCYYYKVAKISREQRLLLEKERQRQIQFFLGVVFFYAKKCNLNSQLFREWVGPIYQILSQLCITNISIRFVLPGCK
jgi:hypothetical protein